MSVFRRIFNAFRKTPYPSREEANRFVKAAMDGELADVKAFLKKYPAFIDVRGSGDNGTALMWACSSGHFKVVEFLLAEGADLALRCKHDSSAITRAAGNGHSRCTSLLLHYGADIETTTGALRFTPLHAAAFNGHANVIDVLLNKKAFIEARNHENAVPLILAAKQGHLSVINILLYQGANIDAQDNMGATAVMWAARKGRSDILKRLLSAEASLENAEEWALIGGYTQEAKLIRHEKIRRQNEELKKLRAVESEMRKGILQPLDVSKKRIRFNKSSFQRK